MQAAARLWLEGHHSQHPTGIHAMMLLANYAARANRAKCDGYVVACGTSHNQSIQRCRLIAVAIAIWCKWVLAMP